MDSDELAQITEAGANAGAAVAAEAFRTDLDVSYKHGKTDVVTQADKAAQAAVAKEIRRAVPDATIYGEEGDDDQHLPAEGPVWIVDPIDGTNNFVRGNRRWTTSVACLLDSEPVAAVNVAPALGDRYVGTPDGVTLNGEELAISERTDPERFAVATGSCMSHYRSYDLSIYIRTKEVFVICFRPESTPKRVLLCSK